MFEVPYILGNEHFDSYLKLQRVEKLIYIPLSLRVENFFLDYKQTLTIFRKKNKNIRHFIQTWYNIYCI